MSISTSMSRSRLVLLGALAVGTSLASTACGDAGGGADDDGDDDGVPDARPADPADADPNAPDADPSAPDATPPGGADAGPATGIDPSSEGDYMVLETDDMAGAVAVTVFAPSTNGTIIAAGSFPVVIVSPGFQMDRDQYASYGRYLATHGFVAISQNFGGGFLANHADLAVATRGVIDWALGADSGLAGHVDATRIGAAGHSLGGKISLLAAAGDARIKAVVGWDPVDANTPSVAPEMMAQIDAAIVVLGETLDGGSCAPTADNFKQYYAAAGSPALEVTVKNAGHMDWVDDTACPFCGFCAQHTADVPAIKAVTRRTTVAWFRRYLLDDASMTPYLTGAVMQADARVTIQSK